MMRDALASNIMRTTLNIDDDVFQAVKDLSRRQKKSAGLVLSDLARKALLAPPSEPVPNIVKEPLAQYGIKPFPKRGNKIVTDELINELREDGPY